MKAVVRRGGPAWPDLSNRSHEPRLFPPLNHCPFASGAVAPRAARGPLVLDDCAALAEAIRVRAGVLLLERGAIS